MLYARIVEHKDGYYADMPAYGKDYVCDVNLSDCYEVNALNRKVIITKDAGEVAKNNVKLLDKIGDMFDLWAGEVLVTLATLPEEKATNDGKVGWE